MHAVIPQPKKNSTPRYRFSLCRAVCVLLGGLPFAALHAQPDPAIEQQRQLQREREKLGELQALGEQRSVMLPPFDQALLLLPHDEIPCFVIRHVNVANQEDASPEFDWLKQHVDTTRLGEFDPVEGRCLGTRGIQQVLARLQDALVARGFITTRVEAPPQDLTQHQLIIKVVPGRIGTIRHSDENLPQRQLTGAIPVGHGHLVRLQDIDQAIENLRRPPSADAHLSIEPGKHAGSSDFVVNYTQARRFRGELSADDSGSRSTGRYLGGLSLAFDNPLRLNDILYAYISRGLDTANVRGKATRSTLLHYSIPYGYWMLTASMGDNAYRQTIAGAFENYVYRGTGSHAQLGVSRVLWRNAEHRMAMNAKLFQRRARNHIEDVEVQVQRRATAGWEIGINQRTRLGPSVIDVSLAYRRGTGAFHAIAAPEEAFGEGSARFKLWTADLQVAAPFTIADQRLSYSATVRGQMNRTPMAPQERFAIGGRFSVRGFDGELSLAADYGVLIRNELGVALAGTGHLLYIGADYGRVGGQSTRWLAGRELAGAVIGVRGGWRRWHYDLFVGTPLHRPEGFRTARPVAGFNTGVTF